MFRLFRRRRPCSIKQGVKIICPHCGAVVVIPMCQAVNGQTITCQVCRKDFIFAS
jgi:uncharacterized protein (DUF983 family)